MSISVTGTQLRAGHASLSLADRWPQAITVSIWLVLLFGIAVRLSQFQANRSLWLDEVLLAMNIVERPAWGLLQPLDYNQEAPIGFLLLSKAAVSIFGNTEMAFRLAPLAGSVLALPLFYLVGRMILTPVATLIGVTLMVFSPTLFRYATQAKPYGSDVCWCLLILLATLWVTQRRTTACLWLYAGIGAVAVWFSYPASLVLAGMGGTLILSGWLSGEKKWSAALVGAAAAWGASFLVLYALFLHGRTGNPVLQSYWGDYFAPLPTSPEHLHWYVVSFFNMFRDVAGVRLAGVGALAFILGCLWYLRTDRKMLGFLVAPLALALVISGLRLYPFAERLLLFAAPLLIIAMAVGVDALRHSTEPFTRWGGTALLVVLLLYPIGDTVRAAINRPQSQEMRPLVEHLQANLQQGDVIYVYHAAQSAFRYYSARYNIQHERTVIGKFSVNDWNGYIEELEPLRGEPRVWVLMSHIIRARVDEAELFEFLLNLMGQQVEAVRVHEAVLFLYDLSEAPSSEQISKRADGAHVVLDLQHRAQVAQLPAPALGLVGHGDE